MFKIGDRVQYNGAGKVARLEGTAGKMCLATVMDIERGGLISVMPDHRTVPDAMFSMGAVVAAKDLTHV